MSEIGIFAPTKIVRQHRKRGRVWAKVVSVRETCAVCGQGFWQWPGNNNTICALCLWMKYDKAAADTEVSNEYETVIERVGHDNMHQFEVQEVLAISQTTMLGLLATQAR